MSNSKADQIRTQIYATVDALDIAGFLKDEVKSLLKYLHYYKLNNIFKNIKSLTDYLLFLDQKNTEQISALEMEDETEDFIQDEQDFDYFLSNNGLQQIGESKISYLLNKNNHHTQQFQTTILGIKGLFLLTANEFCHASMTRMSLNKVLWEK